MPCEVERSLSKEQEVDISALDLVDLFLSGNGIQQCWLSLFYVARGACKARETGRQNF
jgi:hypothetical protein